MKSNKPRIVVLFFILISMMLFIPTNVNAVYKKDFDINSYHIDINVKKNNTLEITEDIYVNYHYTETGIYKTIPLINKAIKIDGTISNKYIKASHIKSSDKYTITKEEDYIDVKIGDDSDLRGEKKYTISYQYNFGKDDSPTYDELSYIIISNEWDSKIDNIAFTIRMPKEFDKSKISFTDNKITINKVNYRVDSKTIMGEYEGELYPRETIAIKLELPDDYFVGAVDSIQYTKIIDIIKEYKSCFIPLIFLTITLIIWLIFGHDLKKNKILEYYPPLGMNCLEIVHKYKGEVENDDVAPLLLYLTNKGYIKIEEIVTDEKYNGFKVIKIKEYDGNNQYEKMFFDGLFRDYSKENNEVKNEVLSKELKDNFYRTTREIVSSINKEKLIIKVSKIFIAIIVLMMIITKLYISIPPIAKYGDIDNMAFPLICQCMLGYPVTIYAFFEEDLNKHDIYIICIWSFIFIALPFFVSIFPPLLKDIHYLIAFVVGIVCIVIMVFCLRTLNRRTKEGNKQFGNVKGFRNFIRKPNKGKLVEIVNQNPSYFYDILPYAYNLNLLDEWFNNFDSIALDPPSWYYSNKIFNKESFKLFIKRIMEVAENVFESIPLEILEAEAEEKKKNKPTRSLSLFSIFVVFIFAIIFIIPAIIGIIFCPEYLEEYIYIIIFACLGLYLNHRYNK